MVQTSTLSHAPHVTRRPATRFTTGLMAELTGAEPSLGRAFALLSTKEATLLARLALGQVGTRGHLAR